MTYAPEYYCGGGDATLANQQAILAAIAVVQAKTDLIGTASLTVAGPVLTGTELQRLRIGDDYKTANGRAITFAFDSIITPVSCTLEFTQDECTGIPDVLTLTGSASATDGVVTAVFEIDADDWAGIDAANYTWVMSVVDSNGNVLSFSSANQRHRFIMFY